MRAATIGRLTGLLRTGVGLAYVVAPASLSAPFAGRAAASPGAQAFIRFFGIRDALLGLTTASARTDEELRQWLRRAAVVDLVDTVSVLAALSRVPPHLRWVALAAPAAPAVVGAALAAVVGRPEHRDVSPDTAGPPRSRRSRRATPG